VLFKAFSALDDSLAEKAVLVYAGDGPQLDELEQLRASLPFGERIRMVGYIRDAADVMRSADVCVVPSTWAEAFGLSVVEMMIRGRPVIATRVGGIPEIIEDAVSGVLVEPSNVASLSAELARLLSSPAIRESLGRTARVRALKYFSIDRQVAQMLDTCGTTTFA
jgi:glycosyltransferase involved in cell wall biosynthesis